MSSEVHPGLALLRHWCPDREQRHEWVRHACQEACNVIRGTGSDAHAKDALVRLAWHLDFWTLEKTSGVVFTMEMRHLIAEFIAEI